MWLSDRFVSGDEVRRWRWGGVLAALLASAGLCRFFSFMSALNFTSEW
jgi:hypothetical protein